MSNALYQQAIKELAKAAHGAGRLAAPDGQASLDNPLCGDRVHMEVVRDNGRIVALAHDTKGCLLCRASASVLGKHAVGQSAEEIKAVHDVLQNMLKAEDTPPLEWREVEYFAPARQFPSRHLCILLPFNALLAALEDG